MIVSTLVVKNRLKVYIEQITRKVGNVVEQKRKVLNPQVQEALVMTHPRLGGFIGNRPRYEMRRLHFSDSAPNCE